MPENETVKVGISKSRRNNERKEASAPIDCSNGYGALLGAGGNEGTGTGKSLVRKFEDKMAETNTSVRYVPICSNPGYAAGNNVGAASASTSPTGYLLFLNDDIELMPRFIQSLYELMATRRPIAAGAPGAVGCKIVSQNGSSLLEAGSIMWSDGSAQGYGRGGRPDAPEFAFARPVDYISGATLAFKPNNLTLGPSLA